MRKTKISYIVAIILSILLTLSIILPSTAYAQEIEKTNSEVRVLLMRKERLIIIKK